MGDRSRQQRRDGAPEQPLLGEAAHLVPGRQGQGELGHDLVAERHPGLERMSHAGAVRLHQQVIDQVDAEVHVLQASELLGVLGLGVARPIDVERIAAAAALRAEQLGARIVGEDLLPGVVALERRQPGPADEALCLVVEARLRRRARQAADQRRDRRRERGHPRCDEIGDVGVVAAEELVGPLPRERHLDRFGRELRDQVGGQSRRVGERLVERLHQLRQELDRVGPQHQLVVVRAVPLCDLPRVAELIEGALLEADREGADPLGALLGGQRRQRRGVDASGEQDPDRHVRDQMGAHGVAEPLAQLDREVPAALGAHLALGDRGRARVARDLGLAPLPGQKVAGGQLARLLEDRQRSRDRVEGQERLQGIRVEVARESRLPQQRLQLRAEGEDPIGDPVVEGLDPEPVPGQQQPAAARVPEREREHSPQLLDEAGPTLLVEVDQDLGVAVGGEGVAAALEVPAQLAVVVDLTVLDHVDAAVLVGDRLVPAREVDDREAANGQADRPVDHHPVAVGAPMHEALVHRRQRLGVGPGDAVKRDQSTDSTHGESV